MEWLNYHHLLYFWVVAREGSIARASETLRLAQPTISGQIHALEDALGEKLFHRAGRNLALTEVGRLVYGYAEDIFSLGREMMDVLRGRPTGRPMRLVVGVADVVPKLIAFRLIQPALRMKEPVQIVCHENRSEHLFAELAKHAIDVVITDAPLQAGMRLRAYNHLLGECPASVFARAPLAAKLRRNFPQSLDGAPFLLPIGGSTLRLSLDHWFETLGIRPDVRGEFQDSALMKVFGQEGHGCFVAPSVIEEEIRHLYHVAVVGRVDELVERFYAVSVERKLKHPAVVAISNAARGELFPRAAARRPAAAD